MRSFNLNVADNDITISLHSSVGEVDCPWYKDNYCYEFPIKLEHDGKSMKFNWYDSIHNYNLGEDELTEEKAMQALSSIFFDASTIEETNSFESWAREMCYDNEDLNNSDELSKCKKSYNECVKHHKRIMEIFGEEKYYKILNALSDMGY